MTDAYLVTSYPPPKAQGVSTLDAQAFSEKDLCDQALDYLPQAITEAERRTLNCHTEVRVWKLHGSPELIQVVKWSQDSEA